RPAARGKDQRKSHRGRKRLPGRHRLSHPRRVAPIGPVRRGLLPAPDVGDDRLDLLIGERPPVLVPPSGHLGPGDPAGDDPVHLLVLDAAQELPGVERRGVDPLAARAVARRAVERPELTTAGDERPLLRSERIGAPRRLHGLVPGEGNHEQEQDPDARALPATEAAPERGILVDDVAHALAPSVDPPGAGAPWFKQDGPVEGPGPCRVPRGGPWMTVDVSTKTWSPLIWIGKRSMPRGAGPRRYSPIRL